MILTDSTTFFDGFTLPKGSKIEPKIAPKTHPSPRPPTNRQKSSQRRLGTATDTDRVPKRSKKVTRVSRHGRPCQDHHPLFGPSSQNLNLAFRIDPLSIFVVLGGHEKTYFLNTGFGKLAFRLDALSISPLRKREKSQKSLRLKSPNDHFSEGTYRGHFFLDFVSLWAPCWLHFCSILVPVSTYN